MTLRYLEQAPNTEEIETENKGTERGGNTRNVPLTC